jgi:hypothetical protein
MSQKFQDEVANQVTGAEVWLKKEVYEFADESTDEPIKWEGDNVRIRENGWVDIWGEEDENGDPYANTVPPHNVIRIIWPETDEE